LIGKTLYIDHTLAPDAQTACMSPEMAARVSSRKGATSVRLWGEADINRTDQGTGFI